MPSPGKPPPNYLMTGLTCLIIVAMALITMFILMMVGRDNPLVLAPAKPWKWEDPVTSRPPVKNSQPPKIPTDTSKKISIAQEPTKKPRNVCETPECIALAHQLHNYHDPSVNPCQDFFKYSCGKYNKHNSVRGSRMLENPQIVQELVGEFLHKNQFSTSESEKAMQFVYQKCEDMKRMDQNQTGEQLIEVLRTVAGIGSWPLISEDWDASKFDLNEMLVKIAEFGITDFGLFRIEESPLPSLEIKVQPFTKNTFKKHKDIVKMMKRVGIEPKLVDRDMKNVLKLKKKLSEIYGGPDNAVGPEHSLPFLEANGLYPNVNFERIVRALGNSKNDDEMWKAISERTAFQIQPLFTDSRKDLDAILKSTSNRTLANFLHFSFYESLTTLLEESDCEKMTMRTFPLASLRVFVRNHLKKENLKAVSDMVENLRTSFIKVLQESSWLHDETKKNVIQEVKKMKKVIGYPDEVPGALDESFKSLNLSSTDSSLTYLSKLQRFKAQRALYSVSSSSPMHSDIKYLLANSQYDAWMNTLVMNAALLDDPLYDSTWPNYANMASIGYVIGREIGHGFDPNGRKKDEDEEENDWWAPEDSHEYVERAQCLIDQYGKNLSGTQTIRESASDNIGNQLSWKAYKKLDISKEQNIIGFDNYNHDALYFRIAALGWCAPRDDEMKVHPSIRMNGVFSNMKEFAKAFNCPVGSPMNPEKKCELF